MKGKEYGRKLTETKIVHLFCPKAKSTQKKFAPLLQERDISLKLNKKLSETENYWEHIFINKTIKIQYLYNFNNKHYLFKFNILKKIINLI